MILYNIKSKVLKFLIKLVPYKPLRKKCEKSIMSNPLISVIIPAYNHENYVQECINSIIEQTYKNIELIIVDDGSKDSTWNKIQ